MVLASAFGGAGFVSSFAMPRLNAFMPPATSPIRSEILLRPKSSRTTTITIIQCQILKEPITRPPQPKLLMSHLICHEPRPRKGQKQGFMACAGAAKAPRRQGNPGGFTVFRQTDDFGRV